MSSGIGRHSPHTVKWTAGTPGLTNPVKPGCTPSHLRRPHFAQRQMHTHRRPHASAHSPPRPLTPIKPGAHSSRAHTCLEYWAPLARALTLALTPPRFPSPLVFLETALRSPPPRPEVLAVFLASLVSAPFPPAAGLRLAPQRPAGYPGHPLPHPHSRGDSRPLAGPRIFPLATWGAGRSPALNFLLRPGPSWRGVRSRAAKSEERGAGGSDSGLTKGWARGRLSGV